VCLKQTQYHTFADCSAAVYRDCLGLSVNCLFISPDRSCCCCKLPSNQDLYHRSHNTEKVRGWVVV
jgi:hypothetical protein